MGGSVDIREKVAIIVPTLKMGGMERVVSLVSNYAAKSGYYVSIICLMKSDIEYTIDDRVDVYHPDFYYNRGLIGKFRIFNYLTSTLKQLKPTVALSFSEVFNPLAIFSAKISKTKIYISDRSNPYIKHRLYVNILRRITYPHAHGMISQTKIAKDIALKKKYNNNISVIANPLRSINNPIKPPQRNVIISVGRLVSSKNYSALIDIFSKTHSINEWELWIIGEGPERHLLQKKIDNLGLNYNIKLLGAIKNIDDYLAIASIFAFTSISEGFPNALSEAIAFPLACIAYDCSAGPRDLISHGKNGFLIPLDNEECFVKHLNILMDNKLKRKYFVSEYKKHRDKYHVDNIANRYMSFICN